MKRFLKITLGVVLGLVVVLGAALAAVYALSGAQLRRTVAVVARATPPVPADAAGIAHGRHIAITRGCLECHGEDLGGADVIDNPAMGRLSGPNLTRGRGGRPADFSDADWVRAICRGVAPDGRRLFLMPSADFARMSDADLGALLAFLEAAAPVDRASIPLRLGPVARVLLVTGKLPFAADTIAQENPEPATVEPGATADYGRYLAVGCIGCHGPDYSGGKIPVGPPDWPPAANLTPAGDLARWSEADFVKALRTAHRPDGSELSPVMPRQFGQFSDLELRALWLYLKTLKPMATGAR